MFLFTVVYTVYFVRPLYVVCMVHNKEPQPQCMSIPHTKLPLAKKDIRDDISSGEFEHGSHVYRLGAVSCQLLYNAVHFLEDLTLDSRLTPLERLAGKLLVGLPALTVGGKHNLCNSQQLGL